MPSWRIKHPSTLVSEYALNGNALDGTGRYPGTLVNTPTWTAGPRGRQCIELDGGTQHVLLGEIAELSQVPAFSICFWFSQDVLDVLDYMFSLINGNDRILISTGVDGRLYFTVQTVAGGAANVNFDYSLYVSATNWHHLAATYDGTQAVEANRLAVYVDGQPAALTLNAGIPTITADFSGINARIGHTSNVLDGKLYDFRIYSVPLSRDEVIQIIHAPVPWLA